MMVRFSAKSASRAMTAVLSASTGTAFLHLTTSLSTDCSSSSKAAQVFQFSTVVEGTQQQKGVAPPRVLQMSGSDDDEGEQQPTTAEGEEEPPIFETTVKIDDGGSDLTDRFKYKVHALMGDYDAKDGAVDDERQDGHIFDAMLSFPVRYTFNIVGKTSGDDSIRDEYIEQIKTVVLGTAGDDEIKCKIIPRGKNFTKVQCEVEVQSSTMINTIYDDLEKMERTIMRF